MFAKMSPLLGAAAALLSTQLSIAGDFDVVINEISYNPFTSGSADEFLELFNSGTAPVNLKGWFFTEGIVFAFDSSAVLEPGGYLVVSPDVERTKLHHGIENVAGPYGGKLDNDGEIITLRNARSQVISRVHYSDGGPWPSHPDGLGPSLELVDPYDQNDLPHKWASSLVLEGTPGRPNSRLGGPPAWSAPEVPRTIVINELRSSSPPDGNDFIELYNRTSAAVNMGGYYIVDSQGCSYRIPLGTTIQAGDFLVFHESALGFSLSSVGVTYAILKADGATWVEGMNPTLGPAGSSFGRYPDGDEDHFTMVTPTPGDPNQLVRETNVVVNEILYHPAFVEPSADCVRQCSDDDQWIELHNRGGTAVSVGNWSLSKAVDFLIPGGTTILAQDYLVIAADRARFLARYPSVAPAKVLGNWTKSLSRNSDTINLNDALGNRVDHVEYGNGSPFNDEEPEDGTDDRTIASSDWPAAASDGTQGRSLELINPSLDNRAGAAWKAGPAGGTPTAGNSTFTATPPPVVWAVENSPVVPRSTEPIHVTCRVSSLSPVTAVEVLWHLDPSGGVSTLALEDNGLSGDEDAADGVYGGSIPAQANGATVAFQVRVRAQDGQTTVIPRDPAVNPYTGFTVPYFLCQVDDASPSANGAPTYRILMTQADLNELESRDRDSNVRLHCTFIADGKAFHTAGIRIRGKGSRNVQPLPWRVQLGPERKFRGLERVNLNSNQTTTRNQIDTEILSADLFRRAGMPYPQEWIVNLVFKGIQGGNLYVYKEALDSNFRDRFFGGSSDGNMYRAMSTLGPGEGDLSYYGPTVNEEYRTGYVKKSNQEEDDYSDVIALCRAFDRVETPDSAFVVAIESLIDPEEWATFFAVQSALSNGDGAIGTTSGEDYFLYHVPASSNRLDKGKFLLLPWDMAETFRSATEQLFRPQLDSVRRFLTHPRFAQLYWAKLVELREGVFSRIEMRKRLPLVDGYFSATRINGFLEDYVANRVAFYDANIPDSITSGAGSVPPTALVEVGDVWKFFRGTMEPSGGNKSWTQIAFNDGAWESGPTGIGYSDGDDATVLSDMEDHYTAVYARRAFTVASPAAITSLQLQVDYDDGFVAYLNGTEIARRNAPGSTGSFVPFDDTASASHNATGTPEAIDVTSFKGNLVAGKNVLSAMILNSSLGSSDLSFIPRLVTGGGAVVGAGCGDRLFTTTDQIGLSGLADAGVTQSVTVNGQLATYDPLTAIWRGMAGSLNPGLNTVTLEFFSGLDGTGTLVESRQLSVLRLSGALRPISGTIAASTVWQSADGPYHMTGNVTVAAGATLTIEPGTIILAEAGASIIVRGLLEADGTQGEPIVFRPMTCDNRWGGIALDNTGVAAASPTHTIRGCDFEFALDASGFTGCISAVSAKVLLEGCTFRSLTANAVTCQSARLDVRGSTFEHIHQAVGSTSSIVTISDCVFRETLGNTSVISLASTGAERSTIESSLIEDCSDVGIRLAGSSVDVRSTTVRFADRGIYVERNGTLGAPSITGCVIEGCGTGLALANGVTIGEGNHDTIAGNQVGVRLFMASGGTDGGHAAFDSMILWHNGLDVSLDSSSTVGFTYSDLQESWQGAGNISAEPRFVSELQGDFGLASGSPAIGSGKDGTDMGAIPYEGDAGLFIRGDADANGTVGLTDAIRSLNCLFLGAAVPICLDRLDANDDGGIDISDPVRILVYLYAGHAAPPQPFPSPGVDPTGDDLACPY